MGIPPLGERLSITPQKPNNMNETMSIKKEESSAKPSDAVAVDYCDLLALGKGEGLTQADQARSLNLKVGNTIMGRESDDNRWHDVKLRVIWMGEKVVVYSRMWRNNHDPDKWYYEGETANFCLCGRSWYLLG